MRTEGSEVGVLIAEVDHTAHRLPSRAWTAALAEALRVDERGVL